VGFDVIATSGIIPRLDTVFSYGASLGAGTGAGPIVNRLGARMAKLLGTGSESNYAVSAAAMCCDNDTSLHNGKPWGQTGGWVTMMQQGAPGARAAQPLSSNKQFVMLSPMGDLPSMGPTKYQSLLPVTLEAVYRWLRAGGTYPYNASGVSNAAGTWVNESRTNRNPGPGWSYSSTENATKRIVVPAFFPVDGKVTVILPFNAIHRPTWTFKKNGMTVGSIDLLTVQPFNDGPSGFERWSPYSFTFTASPGDTLDLVVTNTLSGTRRGHFAGYCVEAHDVPVIVDVKTPRFTDYSIFTSLGYPYTPSDDDEPFVESVHEDAAAAFSDGMVRTIPTDDLMWTGDTPNLELFADFAHPNARGVGMICARIFDLVATDLDPRQVANTGIT
jgi:hypothetical protein